MDGRPPGDPSHRGSGMGIPRLCTVGTRSSHRGDPRTRSGHHGREIGDQCRHGRVQEGIHARFGRGRGGFDRSSLQIQSSGQFRKSLAAHDRERSRREGARDQLRNLGDGAGISAQCHHGPDPQPARVQLCDGLRGRNPEGNLWPSRSIQQHVHRGEPGRIRLGTPSGGDGVRSPYQRGDPPIRLSLD